MDSRYGSFQSPSPSYSPYMNFNPAYISDDDKYIHLEGHDVTRVRRQLAFNQIGLAAIVGSSVGGLYGMAQAMPAIRKEGSTGRTRISRLITAATKRGSGAAQSLGAIAVIYNLFGMGLTFARSADDDVNTFAAATATGLLYKAPGGLAKSMRGGVFGFGLAACYCFAMRRDEIKKMIGLN